MVGAVGLLSLCGHLLESINKKKDGHKTPHPTHSQNHPKIGSKKIWLRKKDTSTKSWHLEDGNHQVVRCHFQ